MRHAPPMRNPGVGAMYMRGNRNKRSAVLDLKGEEGRSALLRICESADVFVHNIRPAAMRRLGLSPEELCGRFPRLVYLSLIGYGETEPYAGRAAYDDFIQGIAGIPALFGAVARERHLIGSVARGRHEHAQRRGCAGNRHELPARERTSGNLRATVDGAASFTLASAGIVASCEPCVVQRHERRVEVRRRGSWPRRRAGAPRLLELRLRPSRRVPR